MQLTDNKMEEQDFLSLMTVVIETVANISVKEKISKKIRMQMPSLASTLRKKLYFPILTKTGPIAEPREHYIHRDEPTPNDAENAEEQVPIPDPAPVEHGDGTRPLPLENANKNYFLTK